MKTLANSFLKRVLIDPPSNNICVCVWYNQYTLYTTAGVTFAHYLGNFFRTGLMQPHMLRNLNANASSQRVARVRFLNTKIGFEHIEYQYPFKSCLLAYYITDGCAENSFSNLYSQMLLALHEKPSHAKPAGQ